MKVSSGVLAAGLAPAAAADATSARALDETPYPVKWYTFAEHPDSDTCWSLSVGPDGRIYAAACAEQLLIDAVTGKGARCPVPQL
jgi:hypothetical protein